MNRTVVLGTNNHPDYINYYPFIAAAWNSLGWNTITFHISNIPSLQKFSNNVNSIIQINIDTIYNDILLSQVYRLMAHNYIEEDDHMIMTSDIDMMPLCDYWQPQKNKITCYGYDLTNRIHYPICYIAAQKTLWKKLIPENSIDKLLQKFDCAKSNKFNDYWYTDQNIITSRIKQNTQNLIEIDRTFNNFGLAYGRIDRCSWNQTLNSQDKKIDAHMPRPFDMQECKRLLFNHFNIFI